MQKVKLHIVDKNKVSRENLTLYFKQSSLYEVCSSSQSLFELKTFLKYEESKANEILLVNVKHMELADSTFLDNINQLSASNKIIIMSIFEEEHLMYNSVKNGAICFLSANQSFVEISEAINLVNNEGTLITPSFGREILKHLNESKNTLNSSLLESFVAKNRMVEIAHQLNTSVEIIYQNFAVLFKSFYLKKMYSE